MMMTRGAGVAMNMSKGHKISMKSSTESEVVGIDDALPDILWGKNFLEAHGHAVGHNILLQDNMSTILLATNGSMSSSKISRSSMIPLVQCDVIFGSTLCKVQF